MLLAGRSGAVGLGPGICCGFLLPLAGNGALGVEVWHVLNEAVGEDGWHFDGFLFWFVVGGGSGIRVKCV